MMKNKFETVQERFNGVRSIRICNHFAFTGFSPNLSSYCRLLLIESIGGLKVVVCSQTNDDYRGTSVTNAVEEISREVERAGFSAWCLWSSTPHFWLEHYPTGVGLLPDRYTLMAVTFDGSEPTWGTNMTWAQASRKTDLPIPALAYGYQHEQAY